jgi:hypothetical protein
MREGVAAAHCGADAACVRVEPEIKEQAERVAENMRGL